jgi:transcriptional regulator of met regulon
MAASRQKRPVANRVKIFLLFSQKRTRRQISHVRKVPKAEVIPTRGVEAAIVRHIRNGSVEPCFLILTSE